jgi:hypothetical protein
MSYLKALALSAIAILAPVHAIMIASGVLIVLDLILGLLAALKQGQLITSAALRRTLSKIITYQVAIITGFLVEKYLVSDLIPITKLVASVIGLVEMKSILENADIINGESIFGSVLKKLGSENDSK